MMVYGILIGVLIYSAVLTCVCIYKNNSSYFVMEEIDAVTAGPCTWVLLLLIKLFRPLFKRFQKTQSDKPYKSKSKDYIEKTVNKVMRTYISQNPNVDDVFDLSSKYGNDYEDVLGWGGLEVKNPKYEGLNKRFERLMRYQRKDTLAVLCPCFDLCSEKYYRLKQEKKES